MASPASGARALPEPPKASPRVAFQGEPGAFSEDGVLSAFAAPQAVAMPTWRAVFEAIHDGSVDAGVVPIERSAGGSVLHWLCGIAICFLILSCLGFFRCYTDRPKQHFIKIREVYLCFRKRYIFF